MIKIRQLTASYKASTVCPVRLFSLYLLTDPNMAPIAIGVESVQDDEPTFGPGHRNQEPKTIPARWMRDENVFQLEKRAIFSKVCRVFVFIASTSGPPLGYETSQLWLLASHTSRFSKPGDYISGVFD